MGIVHNPVDEDLTDIELTLTTGQPVSFDIDLYQARWAERTVIEESERGGTVPTSYGQAYDSLDAGPPTVRCRRSCSACRPRAGAAKAMARSFAREELAETGVPVSISSTASELRCRSSAVPRQWSRSWWPSSMTLSPNVSGGTDRAPTPTSCSASTTPAAWSWKKARRSSMTTTATRVSRMMPYTTRGTHVRLGFARDLAVRCSRTSTVQTVNHRVAIDPGELITEMRRDEVHTIRVEHDDETAVDVIVELPKGYDTVLTPGPSISCRSRRPPIITGSGYR